MEYVTNKRKYSFCQENIFIELDVDTFPAYTSKRARFIEPDWNPALLQTQTQIQLANDDLQNILKQKTQAHVDVTNLFQQFLLLQKSITESQTQLASIQSQLDSSQQQLKERLHYNHTLETNILQLEVIESQSVSRRQYLTSMSDASFPISEPTTQQIITLRAMRKSLALSYEAQQKSLQILVQRNIEELERSKRHLSSK